MVFLLFLLLVLSFIFEVRLLWKVWKDLDSDESGDINTKEVLEYFSKTRNDRLMGWRAVQ